MYILQSTLFLHTFNEQPEKYRKFYLHNSIKKNKTLRNKLEVRTPYSEDYKTLLKENSKDLNKQRSEVK